MTEAKKHIEKFREFEELGYNVFKRNREIDVIRIKNGYEHFKEIEIFKYPFVVFSNIINLHGTIKKAAGLTMPELKALEHYIKISGIKYE